MKFIDLFAGVGGFRLAMERTGHECVWSSDIDRWCEYVYRKQFGSGFENRDIRTADPGSMPDFDCICGGFPCQDLSIAGKRKGLEGSRSGLFYEIIRIAQAKKPKYMFLENVKGLLSANHGWDFSRILIEMDQVGYDAEWCVVNSKDVIPQNRERVIIIGHLRGTTTREVFPIIGAGTEINQAPGSEEHNRPTIIDDVYKGREEREYKDNAPTLRSGKCGSLKVLDQIGTIGPDSEATRVYNPDGISRTIKDGGGMGAKTGLYVVHNLQPRRADRPSLIKNPNAGGHGHLQKEDGSVYCLDAANTQGIELQQRIRRLTPVECERLQTFPDNWTQKGIDEKGNEILISDTQRYKMMGNAVTTEVIYQIAKRLESAEIEQCSSEEHAHASRGRIEKGEEL